MPEVEIGQVVHWFPDNPGTNATAALVTGVGTETISITIFADGYVNGLTRDGVRHASDPKRRHINNEEAGCWDHTPTTKKLIPLAKLVASVGASRLAAQIERAVQSSSGPQGEKGK
jgi:hypothetical protein